MHRIQISRRIRAWCNNRCRIHRHHPNHSRMCPAEVCSLRYARKFGAVFWNGLKKRKTHQPIKYRTKFRAMWQPRNAMLKCNIYVFDFVRLIQTNICLYVSKHRQGDNWPPRLLMQLMPKQLVGNIGQQYLKESRSVCFHLSSVIRREKKNPKFYL